MEEYKNSIQEIIKGIDFKGISAEYILHNFADLAIGKLKSLYDEKKEKFKDEKQKNDFDLIFSKEIIIKSVISNLKKTNRWSKEISFKQAIKSKQLEELFIELELYLTQLRTRIDSDESIDKVSSSEILKELERNLLIFGGPGAGKTTLLKNFCKSILHDENNSFQFSTLFLIKFREINFDSRLNKSQYDYRLFDLLLDELGIIIKYPDLDLNKKDRSRLIKDYNKTTMRAIIEIIDSGNMLLIFDGFDELPSNDLKRTFERDFEELSLSMQNSKFIITSRNGDFNTQLSFTDSYEISPLNDIQIEKFVSNWIQNPIKAKTLFTDLKKSPYYDTSLRPLNLAHLCAIYERRKLVPNKPRHIYGFIVDLLIESWDEQRGIVRTSNYANFYIEKKKEFLSHLAFLLTTTLDKLEFNGNDLRRCYKLIAEQHALPLSQAKKVISEIESHSGLIAQIGHKSFEFSHKSLQEYLTAQYILTLPTILDILIITRIPNEMAIAVSLSADTNLYLLELYKKRKHIKGEFWLSFLERLVIENPDFGKTHFPLLLIFYICKSAEIKYKELLIDSTIKLIDKTSISNCNKGFLKNYSTHNLFEEVTVFINRNEHLSRIRRNSTPLTVSIDNVLLKRLGISI